MRPFLLVTFFIGFFTSQLLAGLTSLSVSPACASAGNVVTVSFTWSSATYDQLYYAIAVSNNNTADADPTDKWLVNGASNACPPLNAGAISTGSTGTITVNRAVTIAVPAGWTGTGFIVVVAGVNSPGTGCSGSTAVAFSTSCGTATYTPTATATPLPSSTPTPSRTITQTSTPLPSNTPSPALSPTNSPAPSSTFTASPSPTKSATPSASPSNTPVVSATPSPAVVQSATASPTPSMGLVKTVNHSTAIVGDTLTFCLQWQNDSSAATTMRIWDTLASYLTYLGCDNACTQSGSLVSWSFAAAAGSSGTVCFAATVNAYP